MASPIIQIIPQAIVKVAGGACFLCSCPAIVALRASVARHQQNALKHKFTVQIKEKDQVIFGACFWHDYYLMRFRNTLLKNDYYFKSPK